MPEMDIGMMEEDLRKRQNPRRFRHTTGVMYTSICLAMRYEEDLDKASLAGLLHDCAKQIKPDKLLAKCLEEDLPVTDSERRNPFLLHGRVGAFLAEHRYGVSDKDILNAITWHTTGRPHMSLLEKIVFTADYIEPGRDQVPDLIVLRKAAFVDLDQAMLMILEHTLDYLKSGSSEIDPMTEETYIYYKNIKNILNNSQ